MSGERPKVVLIAGPNGAGKSTPAPVLLRDTLRVADFVNADVIAQGLSAFGASDQAFAAARIMLDRLHELARQRADFAFESTLASRSFAPWIAELTRSGYAFHLVLTWLPSPEVALARVRARVRVGGHDVPEEVVRRRHARGVANFFRLYAPLAQTWRFYDKACERRRLLATGGLERGEKVRDAKRWAQVKEALARGGRRGA